MLALSVRQPWAWAILYGGKDVENRHWKGTNPGLKVRGRVAIHASARFGGDERADIQVVREIFRELCRSPDDVPYPHPVGDFKTYPYSLGAIIGTVEIVDVVTRHPSTWFFGPYGLVLRAPRPLKRPIPMKGQLGFFNVPDPEKAAA